MNITLSWVQIWKSQISFHLFLPLNPWHQWNNYHIPISHGSYQTWFLKCLNNIIEPQFKVKCHFIKWNPRGWTAPQVQFNPSCSKYFIVCLLSKALHESLPSCPGYVLGGGRELYGLVGGVLLVIQNPYLFLRVILTEKFPIFKDFSSKEELNFCPPNLFKYVWCCLLATWTYTCI